MAIVPVRRDELGDHLPGGYRETPFGRCFVVEWRLPAGHRHGQMALGGLSGAGQAALARLAGDERFPALDRAVFLDVETTGLAGGTGTYVFLVGLAYFAGGALHVEQLFLTDLPDERAFLHTLRESLGRFDGLVTFNGKTFDVPLLQTRYTLARERCRAIDAPHLDLLFPARRVWRHRLETCRLERLEAALLGIQRAGDIPGWQIPSAFFSYLRGAGPPAIVPVFRHNRHDVLTLVALTLTLGDLLAVAAPVAPPLDLYGLARLLADHGELERAALLFERALLAGLPEPQRTEAARQLAATYRRLQRRDDALAIWRRLAQDPANVAAQPYVELAKHCEHALRDHEQARAWTLRALACLRQRVDPRGRRERAEAERRLGRLERKLGSQPSSSR